MRYLGGKSRTAKQIAAIVSPTGLWWEPFCGGLSVSVALAAISRQAGVVSDANLAVISLYRSVQAGWVPPEGGTVTVEDWHAAKLLPDTDPRKALIGIGGSYGAIWFRWPTVEKRVEWHKKQRYWNNIDPIGAAGRSVVAKVADLTAARCAFEHIDFLAPDTAPPAGTEVIYCDPPYEGTTGYEDATGPFDHVAFWRRCIAFSALQGPAPGATIRVYVSEYACPQWVPHEQVWSRSSGCMITGTGSGLDKRCDSLEGKKVRTERLFRVYPSFADVPVSGKGPDNGTVSGR